jgi:hypothetical protein
MVDKLLLSIVGMPIEHCPSKPVKHMLLLVQAPTAPARVCSEQAEAHAGIALHAVEKVHTKALAPPAHVAEGAVVDGPPRLIVPQVADVAVVGGQLGGAGGTRTCR